MPLPINFYNAKPESTNPDSSFEQLSSYVKENKRAQLEDLALENEILYHLWKSSQDGQTFDWEKISSEDLNVLRIHGLVKGSVDNVELTKHGQEALRKAILSERSTFLKQAQLAGQSDYQVVAEHSDDKFGKGEITMVIRILNGKLVIPLLQKLNRLSNSISKENIQKTISPYLYIPKSAMAVFEQILEETKNGIFNGIPETQQSG